MKDTNPNPFGITREELLDLAAQKIADEFADGENLSERVTKMMTERVAEAIKIGFTSRIDAFLTAEMDRLIREKICPVNIWGEPTGKPTTIRESLAARALVFWNETVDSEGRINSGYGGKPRHEWLFGKIMREEFTSAVKQNIVNLVGAFKDAMREDATKKVNEYLNELLHVKSNGDK